VKILQKVLGGYFFDSHCRGMFDFLYKSGICIAYIFRLSVCHIRVLCQNVWTWYYQTSIIY